MKCPKCGYLGYERVERCRNCGYDFSLVSTVTIPDLTLRSADRELAPLDDLSLVDAATAAPPAIAMADASPDLDRLLGDSRVAPRHVSQESRAESMLIEAADDEPLIKHASAPRAPLAVRRATPEVPRLRNEPPRAQALELALDGESDAPSGVLHPGQRAGRMSWPPPPSEQPEDHEENATVIARVIAVAIDLLLLAAIDAIVIYFTMQICGLTVEDLGILPKGPLLAFLLVQNGGYLVAFTAGGQTLGKMAAGIRVVPTESRSLDLGHAFLRELMWFLLAVPAGLGFVTALFRRDHRGLHDRFAGTRVVRATA